MATVTKNCQLKHCRIVRVCFYEMELLAHNMLFSPMTSARMFNMSSKCERIRILIVHLSVLMSLKEQICGFSSTHNFLKAEIQTYRDPTTKLRSGSCGLERKSQQGRISGLPLFLKFFCVSVKRRTGAFFEKISCKFDVVGYCQTW